MKMKNNFIKRLLLATFLLGYNIIYAQEVKILPPNSEFDTRYNYFHKLLEKIFKKNENKYGKMNIVFASKMEHGRAFVELEKNNVVDIFWAGSEETKEKRFHAIKIPLLKGLLGFRTFILNKDKIKDFDKVKTFEEFKKFKACQGTHWADTKILENAGIKVVKNTNYELLFLQTLAKRCDYFPRGIYETYLEMDVRKDKYKKLAFYDKIILHYPFAMYFYVSKKNKKLGKRIEDGLLKLIESGEFDKYLENYEMTKKLFPVSKWINRKTFVLKNPFLSKETNTKNEKFWIQRNNK